MPRKLFEARRSGPAPGFATRALPNAFFRTDRAVAARRSPIETLQAGGSSLRRIVLLGFLTAVFALDAGALEPQADDESEAGPAVRLEAEPEIPDVDPAEIDELIGQLAADHYLDRERAQRELLRLKHAARPALERALESDDVEQRLRAELILTELRRDDLWLPSTVSLADPKLAVLKAFREISDQTGNPVNWDLTPKSLNRTVQVDWENETYWRAVDQLSRQADVVPRFYDDPKRAGVVLTHGYLSIGPTDYVGPLRANMLYARHMLTETLNFGDTVPDRQESLEMTMALHWEQRLPLCRYGQPTVLEAVTDQGEQLAVERKSPATALMHVTRRQRQLVFTFRLNPPEKKAEKLTSLRLSTPLVAAGDFVSLELTDLQPPTMTQAHGYSLELADRVKVEKTDAMTVLWSRPNRYDKMNSSDMVDEYLEVLDKDGKVIAFHQQKVIGNPSQAQFTIQVPEKVGRAAGLRYNVARLKSQKNIEFRFDDVPLPGTIR